MRGTVVDMSVASHRPVGGLPVELQVRRNGQTLSAVKGRTDVHGRFALAAPTLPRGATYAVVAIYRSVPYGVDVTAGQAAHPFQVPVYDTTASDAQLAAMRVVIGVRRVGAELRVIEQWPFANAGSQTVVGGDVASGRGAAHFLLPPGATHVTVGDVQPPPATAGVDNGRVTVNALIRPATGLNLASLHQVTFTFAVPIRSNRPTLLIPTRYFIGSLYVFTVGSKLVAPGFKKASLPVGGRQIPALERDAVPPGSTLAVGVGGPPAVAPTLPSAPPAASAAPAPFPTASVAAMIEVGFVALLLLALRGRSALGVLPALATPRGRLALQRERARLVGAIAELDLQHARGRVAESEYRRRRTREKGRLLAVARQLGE